MVLLEQACARVILFASDIRLVVLLFSSGVYDACRFWPQAISGFRQVQWKHRMWLFAVNFGALGIVWTISQLIDLGLSYFSSSYVTALRYFIYLLSLVWLIPTWIAAIVINIWLNSKIVSATASRVRVIGGPARPAQPRPEVAFFAELVAEISGMLDEILTVSLVNLTMTIISALTPLIPVFGKAISFVQTAMIYGHTCFETRLSMQKLKPKERIQFVDKHWLYFLGFGTPLTALTFFLPFFLSTGLYSSLLPLYALMSLYASPVRAPLGRTRIPERISYASEAFSIVTWLKARYYQLDQWYRSRTPASTVSSKKEETALKSGLPSPVADPQPASSSSQDATAAVVSYPAPPPAAASPGSLRHVDSWRSIISMPSPITRQSSLSPFTANGDVPEVGVLHQAQNDSATAPLPPPITMPVPVLLQPEAWGSLADASLTLAAMPVPIQTLPPRSDDAEQLTALALVAVDTDALMAATKTVQGQDQQNASGEPHVLPVITSDPAPVQVISAFPNAGPITVFGSEQGSQQFPLPVVQLQDEAPLTPPEPPRRRSAAAMHQINT